MLVSNNAFARNAAWRFSYALGAVAALSELSSKRPWASGLLNRSAIWLSSKAPVLDGFNEGYDLVAELATRCLKNSN